MEIVIRLYIDIKFVRVHIKKYILMKQTCKIVERVNMWLAKNICLKVYLLSYIIRNFRRHFRRV